MTPRERAKDCVGYCEELGKGACVVCIKKAITAAVAEELAKWMSATEHPATCGYVNGPKPPCTCGAHARLAELHAEAARAIRARQKGQ